MIERAIPAVDKIWNKDIITYRRFWLDYCLTKVSPEMHGVVIDLGGKRTNKRGSFEPPEHQSKNWWYINIDRNTIPNVFGNVTAVPFASESCNCIVCTEVLEHLTEPGKCVDEIHRLLLPGGKAFVSIPFLFPIHADPYDFQRFTDDGLRWLFREFTTLEIIPMGGYLGVMGMFIELGVAGIKGQQLHKKVTRRLLTWLARWLCAQDLKPTTQPEAWTKFTTGYFLRAIK
jgi:SAM-dependent methyltransferase